MSRRAFATGAQAGFTLVEVVLALTIFALIGTILYGAFSLGHGAMEKVDGAFEKNQRLRSLGDLLSGYVRSSHPYRPSVQDPGIFYVGEERDLSFVSSVSVALGGRGMAKIHLSVNGDGAVKLEEEMPVWLEGEAAAGYRHSVVLLEGVDDFRLAYLDSRGDEEAWVERWDGAERKTLPRAVRLRYRGVGGPVVEWVFPVMMSALAP